MSTAAEKLRCGECGNTVGERSDCGGVLIVHAKRRYVVASIAQLYCERCRGWRTITGSTGPSPKIPLTLP